MKSRRMLLAVFSEFTESMLQKRSGENATGWSVSPDGQSAFGARTEGHSQYRRRARIALAGRRGLRPTAPLPNPNCAIAAALRKVPTFQTKGRQPRRQLGQAAPRSIVEPDTDALIAFAIWAVVTAMVAIPSGRNLKHL
jgi:hypothetical protein